MRGILKTSIAENVSFKGSLAPQEQLDKHSSTWLEGLLQYQRAQQLHKVKALPPEKVLHPNHVLGHGVSILTTSRSLPLDVRILDS